MTSLLETDSTDPSATQSLLDDDILSYEDSYDPHSDNGKYLSEKYDLEKPQLEPSDSEDFELDIEEPESLYCNPRTTSITAEQYETLLKMFWTRVILIGWTWITFGTLSAAGIFQIKKGETIIGICSFLLALYTFAQICHIQGVGSQYLTRKVIIIGIFLSTIFSFAVGLYLMLARNDMISGSLSLCAGATEMSFFWFYRYPNGKAVLRSSFFE